MITVTLYRFKDGSPKGFNITGHAGAGASGKDIVCSAVSSAAYLTANTLLEVIHLEAEAAVEEGFMRITVPEKQKDDAKTTLLGFELHIKALTEQYPANIKIITEV